VPIELSDIPRAELAALVRAVRVAPRRQFDAPRQRALIALLLFSAGISIFLHAASTRAWSLSPISSDWHEDIQMRGLQNVVVVSSLAIAGATHAQNAVEWRVKDGGNGHWYEGVETANGIGWASAQVACVAAGGSLVSIGTAAESSWLYETIACRVNLWSIVGPYIVGPWIGARGASGNWRWDDGTPWNYSAWFPGEGPPSGDPGEQFAHFYNGGGPVVVPNNSWADYFDLPFIHSYLIEWSADCNNDSIIDYGQILAGTLADANQNNIPDCCEAGSSCPDSAVQWRVEDGGNGHWYQFRRLPLNHCWTQARNMCEADGGHLATITSAPENNLLRSLTIKNDPGGLEGGPYIGGTCVGLPWGQFYWITGEPFVYTNWLSGAPNGSQGETEQYLQFWRWSDLGWNDAGDCGGLMFSHLIEWSADCNNDSIIDYGQILAGELEDLNANNIPDCCEGGVPCSCPADLDGNGEINSIDLAIILDKFGTDGGKDYPNADIDGSGIVDAADLTAILSGWGACQ
jgi:hypothetical protein